MRLLHLCHIDKDLFEVHLQLHQQALETDCVGESHMFSINVYTAFLQDHSGLWNLQNTEAHLTKHHGDLGERCCLASTGTTSQADPRDRQLIAVLTGLTNELLLQPRRLLLEAQIFEVLVLLNLIN